MLKLNVRIQNLRDVSRILDEGVVLNPEDGNTIFVETVESLQQCKRFITETQNGTLECILEI